MNILVLGSAVSGIAAAHLARSRGHQVSVYDQSSHAVSRLRGDGFTLHSGTWSGLELRATDLVVTSPGIPEHAPPIQATIQSGIPLISEMEFAVRHLDAPYVAVTGTNGKTTVAEAAAEMLIASGQRALAAGNIGTALSGIVDEDWDTVVIEASSFQLRFADEFHPSAAAITNVAPDHLDWHASEAAYADAKARIYARMTPDDVIAYDADDRGARSLIAGSSSSRIAVSGSELTTDGYGVHDGMLVLGDLRVAAPPIGPAFLADLALSAVLARRAGASDDAIAAVVEGFVPGAHRRTVVASWRGVDFVDDSKATNPHAAVASARSYPSVVLIAGGRNKGLDLSPLASVEGVRYLVGIGEAADELAGVVTGGRFHRAADMTEAVAVAAELAAPGDVVLLAPGCASFDMYESYAARGDAFAAAVRNLAGAA
ncbi:MAG: UDP-N-acetylmuramoyl-L-alanine--D-glutamate ligase [Acidimicrobiia bacterium]|nr:UDP-N-acetylmuramoyl-L-alanine--D-glutamate ligase [Acidimicrobiia bacterium]